MEKKNIIEDFYKMNLLDNDLVKMVKEEDCEDNLKLLFLLRFYWKMMGELDDDKGYNVKDWKFEDYNKFLDRLDEVDLNNNDFRKYFKELINFLIVDIKDNKIDFIKYLEQNKVEIEKKNNIEV